MLWLVQTDTYFIVEPINVTVKYRCYGERREWASSEPQKLSFARFGDPTHSCHGSFYSSKIS